ncbi:hypothetical protein ES319_D10G118200v1 [Gossypium barbadense]|uniref:FBD domain-containing protein n=1 Tax=Gossypium barbadense TaxID=3634 RepID=A0A5J5PQN7_GOSBA|nr:hypothetical protein ES319_D10G118200v1 [Gossypium barbadense]
MVKKYSFHIKETKISGVDESKYAFEMISYFLNYAMVLEKHILRMINLLEKDELCILKKLLRPERHHQWNLLILLVKKSDGDSNETNQPLKWNINHFHKQKG